MFVVVAAVFIACSQGEEENITIPENVLSEEKYVNLLVDFSLAESASNLNIKNLSGRQFDSTYAFNPLKENNISQGLYDSTIAFYSRHPKVYKKIYEEVLTKLSNLKTEREKIKKDTVIKPVVVADSLAKKTYTVILKKAGKAKIGVIRVVKELTGMTLKEAKDLVDKAPGTIKKGISKEEAEKIKKALQEAGAKVQIK